MVAAAGVLGHRYLWIDEKVCEAWDASELYRHAHGKALWGRLYSALTGRTRRLLSLASVEPSCTVSDRRDSLTRIVPIKLIRGSANRCHDFDADFRPLHSHSQARWICLAAAHRRKAKLPPVDLIEAAGIYFVVDGHHRISVANALGDTAIRARVTTWQAAGPSPEERTQD